MMSKKTVVTETKEININKRPVSNHAILNILDQQQTQEKLANSDSNKAVHTLCHVFTLSLVVLPDMKL